VLVLLVRGGTAQVAETKRDIVFRKIDGQEFKSALEKRGAASRVIEVRGGHGDFTLGLATRRRGEEPEYWRQVRAFLKKHWLERK
jgi:hypothetical protein